MTSEPFQVFSDGKRFAVVTGDTAYVAEEVFLERVEHQIIPHIVDVTTTRDLPVRKYTEVSREVRFELSFIASGPVSIVDNFDPIDMGILQDISVFELFRLINRKVKEREEKDAGS